MSKMMPANNDFIKWLNEQGELREDTPKKVREDHAAWKEHYEKWEKEGIERVKE